MYTDRWGAGRRPTPLPDIRQERYGPGDGHRTDTEGRPEWKTGGRSAAVEARHGLETHVNYK